MWVLLSIFGAVWRRIDGSSNAPKFWHLLPLVFTPVIYYMYGLNLVGAYLIAWVAMLDGFKDWNDAGYMAMRFTGYTALSCSLFGIGELYILCGFLSGMSYIVLGGVKVKNFTENCELITGALLFGGLFVV